MWESRLSAKVEDVWDFHRSAEALRMLTPPDRKIIEFGSDLEVRNGALHVLHLSVFGISIEWRARISDVNPPNGFVDTAEKSPFTYWRHQHEFLPIDSGTLLRDTVEYQPPFGPIGRLANALFIQQDLNRLFEFRHSATRKALENFSA